MLFVSQVELFKGKVEPLLLHLAALINVGQVVVALLEGGDNGEV